MKAMTTLLTMALALVPLLSGPALGGITSGSPSRFESPARKHQPPVAEKSMPERPSRVHIGALLLGRPGTDFALSAGAQVFAQGKLADSGVARIELVLPAVDGISVETLLSQVGVWSTSPAGGAIQMRVLAVEVVGAR